MKKKILNLEAGRLVIEMHGNAFADISFEPSPTLCKEYAAKFCKGSATASKTDLLPNTHAKLNPAKQQNSASYEHSFSELSAMARLHIRNGNFGLYSKDLFDMASIVKKEDKRIDELKLRMMKFHIDLSGLEVLPFIDWENVDLAGQAYRSSKERVSIDELFFDTIKASMTPRHDFTVRGSHRMFLLALDGNRKKTAEIIDILAKYRTNH